ncbi:MAG: YlbF family regulator [Acholeplasmatales bacterium]|nr:YlbF family regulator [Acholeplasmatales bacterium]
MNNIEALKNYFNDLPEVKRIHELEHYIDNNKDIKKKFSEVKAMQKKLVNAKEFNQVNQYKTYEEEYTKLKSELLDMPFVEEYLELLDLVDQMLISLTDSIEYKLDKKING